MSDLDEYNILFMPSKSFPNCTQLHRFFVGGSISLLLGTLENMNSFTPWISCVSRILIIGFPFFSSLNQGRKCIQEFIFSMRDLKKNVAGQAIFNVLWETNLT
jgi:hypothetical protein